MFARSRSLIEGNGRRRHRISYNRNRAERYKPANTSNWLDRIFHSYEIEEEDLSKKREPQTQSSQDEKPPSAEIPKIPIAPIAPEEELAKVITVKKINLNIDENTSKHYTSDYENTKQRNVDGKKLAPELVIRRGFEFDITVTLSRAYDKKIDNINFIFTTGDNPLPKSRTHASCTLRNSDYKPNNWGIRIVKTEGETLTLAVFIPADSVIGKWKMVVKTVLNIEDGKEKSFRYDYPNPFIVLLNPWCQEDSVYLSTEKLLDEYILNDGGALFYGNYRQIGSRGWNFAQFADGILDAALYLLEKSFGFKVNANMGEPVFIARALSRIVNHNDDDGLLVGNWSGNYSDGTRPTAWAGSVKIIRQYMKNKEPVKYGQCWVFSGVLTTLCRALGLPCRSVTNFASAHDTDSSCTIDKVFEIDEDGDLVKTWGGNSDSTWNFHVWNEVWMARPDLDYGYDGWQVIDATPQETSEGVYCLGPSPVSAVKKGEIDIGYDTAFVFAEVNADAIDWLVEDRDDFYVLAVNKTKIGKKISTKKATGVGYSGDLSIFGRDKDREDLTLNYKFMEGTDAERDAVSRATSKSGSHKQPNVEDTAIELYFDDKDGIMVGEDFTYTVRVVNTSDSKRNVKVSLTLTTETYDESTIDKVATKHFEQGVDGNSEVQMSVDVLADKYLEKTVDHFSFKATAFCIVKEEKRAIALSDDFRLRRPDIVIEAPFECKKDDVLDIRVYFDNPLNIPLTNCSLLVEGSLLLTKEAENDTIPYPDVPAKSRWETQLSVKPKQRHWNRQERDLMLSFDCDELPDIAGLHTLNIV